MFYLHLCWQVGRENACAANRALPPTPNPLQLRIWDTKSDNVKRSMDPNGKTDPIDKSDPLFCGFSPSLASVFDVSPGRKKVSCNKPTEKYPAFIMTIKVMEAKVYTRDSCWNKQRKQTRKIASAAASARLTTYRHRIHTALI